MVIVASLSFMIFQFIGDPVIGMLREGATVQERNELRERLDLDKPVLVQFKRFLEFVQELAYAGFRGGDLFDLHPIHPGRALVGSHPRPSCFQHIAPIDPVV